MDAQSDSCEQALTNESPIAAAIFSIFCFHIRLLSLLKREKVSGYPFRYSFSLEKTWNILENQCFENSVMLSARIHAFVAMSNHTHMLISTPQQDLGQVMMHFMRSITQLMNCQSGRSGHVFAGRYHWSLIHSDLYFA